MRLAVWGISSTLKEIEKHPYYLDEFNICLYIDSDNKWRKNYYKGKKVIRPEEIKDYLHEVDYIIIATPKYQDEIYRYSKENGFANKMIPIEIIYPFIELHFNEIVETWNSNSDIQILKNWYVEGDNRSMIIRVDEQAEKMIAFRLFPKWCFGNRPNQMKYKVTNLQNDVTESCGNVDIGNDILINVKSNKALYKITTTGLNSCFVIFSVIDKSISNSEISNDLLDVIKHEKSYNYDYKWHEFDYEFLEKMQWDEKYTILDIGANLGQSTENFLDNTIANVMFIEANPSYRKVLSEIQNKYVDRANYIPAGAGAEKGELNFYIPKFESNVAQESSFYRGRAEIRVKNALGVTVTDDNWEEYIENKKVNVIPVDELAESFSAPLYFVKIDVEDYEYQVIKGMSKTIEKYKPIILLEFNSVEQQKDIFAFVNAISKYRIMYWDYIRRSFSDKNYCCSFNYFLIPEGSEFVKEYEFS